MEVHVEGVKELSETLRRAARSLDKKEVDEIIKSSAEPLVRMAKQDASAINKGRVTYHLTRSRVRYTLAPGVIAKSIRFKKLRNSHSSGIVAPIYSRDRRKDPWFAHFVHEGTAQRSYKGKNRGSITGSMVVPFMERAGKNLDQTRRQIETKLIRKLESIGL